MSIRTRFTVAGLCASLLTIPGCGSRDRPARLILASTTSTEDSGLFDVLIPAFERAHPQLDVVVVAVGTGEALELGRRGDADVVLVHAPAAESVFVAEGHATQRLDVMVNDFVLVGPAEYPAAVRGATSAAGALRRIEETRSPFISRGDDSGTHRKERELWAAAGIQPGGEGYIEAGQGMGDVLAIAGEKRAYTLSDRSTFLALGARHGLVVLFEGDPVLLNPYAVIPVTRAANPEGARVFADWITSDAGQSVIARFGVEQFGAPLFRPAARSR
ncbi:MAG: substrate-binding domain-containing protein [Gemmatimonadetes bacterium]|nr:substrate-binding domain-containing protein [Gemmatimonadota bacterium]